MRQEVPDELAQASWLLKAEEIPLAQASWFIALASGTLKYYKNDPFSLHPSLISGSNKQQSKIRNTWMNLLYVNKSINKCTIYKINRYKGSL